MNTTNKILIGIAVIVVLYGTYRLYNHYRDVSATDKKDRKINFTK